MCFCLTEINNSCCPLQRLQPWLYVQGGSASCNSLFLLVFAAPVCSKRWHAGICWPRFPPNLMFASQFAAWRIANHGALARIPYWALFFDCRRNGLLRPHCFLLQPVNLQNGEKSRRLGEFYKSEGSAEAQSRWWKLQKECPPNPLNSPQIKYCRAELLCVRPRVSAAYEYQHCEGCSETA